MHQAIPLTLSEPLEVGIVHTLQMGEIVLSSHGQHFFHNSHFSQVSLNSEPTFVTFSFTYFLQEGQIMHCFGEQSQWDFSKGLVCASLFFPVVWWNHNCSLYYQWYENATLFYVCSRCAAPLWGVNEMNWESQAKQVFDSATRCTILTFQLLSLI